MLILRHRVPWDPAAGAGPLSNLARTPGSDAPGADCRYLAHSKIAITLAKAKADGCRPCSV